MRGVETDVIVTVPDLPSPAIVDTVGRVHVAQVAPADLPQPSIETPRAERPIAPRARVILWLIAGVVLLAWLDMAPVRRTQEARVLETARQMIGTGWSGWMLPYLNGVPRLQKPPLTYWMAAAAFKVGGVNEFAGRTPFVFLAWLTLGLTYAAGQRFLKSEAAGVVGAATLLGALLFFRNSRLAETDGPATFFVTLAVYAFWRAASSERQLRWYHVGAIGVGGAVMSKGPPGAYPVLFLLLLPLILRDRGVRVLTDFLKSGALATAVLLAAPWYAYVYWSGHWDIVGRELEVVAAGEGHGRPAYNYIPAFLLAMLPWSVAAVVAIWGAVRQAKRGDVTLRVLLAWAGAVVVPLLFIGNKQIHYLLPALPPIALMFAWAITAARVDAPPLAGLVRVILGATLGVGPVAAVAIPIIGHTSRKAFWSFDFILAACVVAAFVPVLWLARRRGTVAAVIGGAIGAATLTAIAEAWWLPNVDPDEDRIAAAYVRQHVAPGPYCFYGGNVSLPLCFDLRQAIPLYRNPEDLARARRERPDLVAISVIKPEKTPPDPPGMVRIGEPVAAGEVVYRFFRAAPAASATQPPTGGALIQP